jgi:hypothetical protein
MFSILVHLLLVGGYYWGYLYIIGVVERIDKRKEVRYLK